MIERIEIENFGSIRKAAFELTPLHAFIGPNDAGKTTILEAVQAFARAASGASAMTGRSGRIDRQNPARFGARFLGGAQWQVGGPTESGPDEPPPATDAELKKMAWKSELPIYHFAPSALRDPRKLLLDDQSLQIDESGGGLGVALDALQNRQFRNYAALHARFLELFPQIQDLIIRAPEAGKKAVGIRLKDGREMPAKAMSEGMLYWLGFAVLQYADRAPLLLVEEPETGLHPARIAEVIGVLRKIAESGTQVLLTTHSPLVVNELAGNEITVVTRTDEAGTVGTRLCDIPDYESLSKAFKNGELWITYCDGVDERELLGLTP